MAYQGLLLGDIIDKLGSEYAYEQNDIKGCISSLVSADCFMREPKDAKLSEQKLSFIYSSTQDAIDVLKEAMNRKLKELLGSVKDDIFAEVFS
jgi:hypothetical protein